MNAAKRMRPVAVIATVAFSGLESSPVSGFAVPVSVPRTLSSARTRTAFTRSLPTFPSSAKATTSSLGMSDTPADRAELVVQAKQDQEELDELRDGDPLGFVIKDAEINMDMNSIINTGVIVCVAIGALATLATVDFGMMRGWNSEEIAFRIPVDNWNSYTSVLNNSPISTKAITSATVYSIGDFIAQRTEGATMGTLDRGRNLRSLLAGLIGHGPLSHVWYGLSEHLFGDVLGWTAWWSFAPKIVLDQTIWGPIWNNCYITLLGIMKRESFENIWGDVKRTTIPLVLSGLKLWPLAHCVTYGLVPVENRLLWVDLVEILWVTILATQAAGGRESELDQTAVEKRDG